MVGGVQVSAAGIVPYTELRGRGLHFMMQTMTNGTREGKLSDFGGRREQADVDLFYTAAREFTEETGGAFGDVHELAARLRTESTVRILNRPGKYMTFFLKVEYVREQHFSQVDDSSNEAHERECKWWRADELLGNVDEERLLARLVNPRIAPLGEDAASSSRRGLSSFHKAVCKTIALENAHPDAHERWHSTVLNSLAAAASMQAAQDEDSRLYIASTAQACAPPLNSGSYRPRRAQSRRPNSRGKARKGRAPPRDDLYGFSP